MFGIVRPCRHSLCGGLHREWLSHLCGLCLTLRDRHGHAARLVTNYDGLLVSVLTEAQARSPYPRRRAAPCALRGFAAADVVDARAEGARLAAAASLILAAGKIGDHVRDGDGLYGRPAVARGAAWAARRWDRAGAADAAELAFDTTVLAGALARQPVLEARPAGSVLDLTEPAESAVAAVFAHTGVLTGRPHNVPALAEAGRFFGRLAHLLDAVEDLAADRASGSYNPLAATGTGPAQARRLCDDAARGLALAVADLDLRRSALVRALLVTEVARTVDRVFAAGPGTGQPGTETPRRQGGPALGCLAGALTCCTCGLYESPGMEEERRSCTDRCGDCCDACGSCGDCCQACSSCGECCNGCDGCDGCSCDCGCN
ncbi:hypothetical protein Misp01_60060 [Microtetraspora sp. NBRC 13810]|uniref:DUF5685 family protein n=1 Tax=Microtetraspora sp. NBRC 13810 TaxID=3030990 RepID=UPI0024A41EF5|nr:DUF5685 family protein [Microtetraspora sp. NBRC 13810]GLW10878.1 hypothetical protein Misp01_60060 [Microtetraspora sp. NBRC 13810]